MDSFSLLIRAQALLRSGNEHARRAFLAARDLPTFPWQEREAWLAFIASELDRAERLAR